MNDFLYISEQDIFNYVHFPELLAPGKAEYLQSHEYLFSETIKLCRSVRDEMNDENRISDEIRRKLSTAIPLYREQPVILQKLPGPLPVNQTRFTLAAASETKPPASAESRTFINEQKSYLIRLVPEGEATHCYVFTPEGILNQKFRLSVLPSDQTFDLSGPDQVLDLSPTEPVEQLSLTIT